MGVFTGFRRRGSLFLALLAVLGVLALPAAAGPEDQLEEIEQKQDRAERKLEAVEEEQSELETDIAGLDSARDAIEERVAGFDAELADLDADLDKVKEELVAAQNQLTVLTAELRRLGNRLERRTELLEAKAVAAYKAGPAAAVDGLLAAESFSDLVDRIEYYESSLEEEAALIAEIETLESETEDKRDEVEERKQQIAAQKLELEEDRAEIAALREERAGALAEKETILEAKEVLLADAEQREAQLEEWAQQLEADSQRIESIIAAQSAGVPGSTSTGTPPAGGGQLQWPTDGPLTSPYGYRVHPIFGDTRLHSGIDIGAPYGAGVYAAEDGTVTYVGAMSGYGNVVVIDHGGGLSTTYNHLSGFSVSSGQSVSRGAHIASVGCTGYCTGPHLHFEVRVNGSPVDPMPYLQ